MQHGPPFPSRGTPLVALSSNPKMSRWECGGEGICREVRPCAPRALRRLPSRAQANTHMHCRTDRRGLAVSRTTMTPQKCQSSKAESGPSWCALVVGLVYVHQRFMTMFGMSMRNTANRECRQLSSGQFGLPRRPILICVDHTHWLQKQQHQLPRCVEQR